MNPDVLEQWLTLAEKHGLSVVLLAITIIVIFAMVRWMGHKFDQLWATVIEVKNNIPDTTQESVEKVTRLNRAIKGVLKEIQLDFKPDWIHIWQFHNGNRIMGKNRIPFMFISLTYELVMDGYDPVQAEFVQIPMSMVDSMIYTLIDNPLLVEKTNPEGFADNPISLSMFKRGVTVQDLLPIKDETGAMIAILELCFITPPNLDDNRKNILKGYAQRLSITVATYDEVSLG